MRNALPVMSAVTWTLWLQALAQPWTASWARWALGAVATVVTLIFAYTQFQDWRSEGD